MTWAQQRDAVTLTCDGQRHLNDTIPMLYTRLAEGEIHLSACQRVWEVAAGQGCLNTWTSTSTEHFCPDCTRRRAAGNPQAGQ